MSRYHPTMLRARLQISIAFSLSLILLVFFSTSAWEAYPPFDTALFAFGCILVGIASLGRLWCSLYIAGYKTDKLVAEGPYSLCRNPLYLFTFIGGIGCGLATETFTIPLLFILFFALYYPFVIKSEETELKDIHKEDFVEYLRTTPAFFPKFSLLSEPSSYVVKPKIFRKHIFDALWFVWIVGILEFIEGVHEMHIIPIFFKLY